MNFEYTNKINTLIDKINVFMDKFIYPNERVYFEAIESSKSRWNIPPVMEEIKVEAKKVNLWNLFLPDSEYGAGLSNLEYAPLAELMGRSFIAPEAFNCSAPDTGNMEVFVRYGTTEQKEKWLDPLLNGEIRSAFAMTEPNVASSDATNIESTIKADGDDYIINGHKWWTSGAMDPRCKVIIFMGKTDLNADRYSQQSMIIVPADAPGVKIVKPLSVFGYDDAPHGHAEIIFKNVRVPKKIYYLERAEVSKLHKADLVQEEYIIA